MNLLQAQALCKTYGTGETAVQALKDVSFSVPKGEFVAVVGESGSGKSTLLNLLGGLDMPTTGTVLLEGRDIYALSDKQRTILRRRRIGFVFQFHQLLPEFTALENVMIPALIAGTSSSEAMQKAKETLTFLGLSGRASHKPAELSGGEKQRVAVARALINSPAVILADEPSGSLDTRNKEELHQLFFDLRDKLGQTFVIVTHDESLARLTDRTIHMVDGRISSEV